jgi:hypothetical protein
VVPGFCIDPTVELSLSVYFKLIQADQVGDHVVTVVMTLDQVTPEPDATISELRRKSGYPVSYPVHLRNAQATSSSTN